MTPQRHYDEAVTLLKDAQNVEPPSEARVLAQAAIAHGLLGILELEMRKLYGPEFETTTDDPPF